MRIRIAVDLPEATARWVLIQSRLDRRGGYRLPSLAVSRLSSPESSNDIPLLVRKNGLIREVIELPDDCAGLIWEVWGDVGAPPSLTVSPLNWLQRTWRMAFRVLTTYMRISPKQRTASGLCLRLILADLPAAYRVASAFMNLSDRQWAEWIDVLDERDLNLIQAHIGSFPRRPYFHVLIMVGQQGTAAVQTTVVSLQRQLYRNCSCVVLDQADTLANSVELGVQGGAKDVSVDVVAAQEFKGWLDRFNVQLSEARADDWVMLLHAGDQLPVHALYWFAGEVLARPHVAILYADDDELDGQGRRIRPRFKPDWSLAHLRSTPYIGRSAVIRGCELAAAGGLNVECWQQGTYDLLLRVVDHVGAIVDRPVGHVPAVLLHRGPLFKESDRGEWPNAGIDEGDSAWCLDAVRRHLLRSGVSAEVLETHPGCWRVRYHASEDPPFVSIIVPTRDRVALIRQCLESVMAKTSYPRFEILVVDNQSTDPASVAYLAAVSTRPPIRVLRYDRPFNFSAVNNVAVTHAVGDVLCLLNNDTEVISPDWLDEMVGQLMQDRVGIVGAKLYYPDGRIQHAGDVVGVGGVANHLHAYLERDDPGYGCRAIVAQDLSAVTGACMVTWKKLYREVGGLDERHLPVAFNDVDYCLRIREAGYRVVWTPHAELFHHESASRGGDASIFRKRMAKTEAKYMRRKWGDVMQQDPFYSPNLNRTRQDFSLSSSPRGKKPWC